MKSTNGVLDIPSMKGLVSNEEWELRESLACAYRLCAYFGWDDLIYTHISAKVPNEENHFLMNPLGLMFDEITASSLVKIDHDGNIIMDTPFSTNKAGFVIHSTIHGARADANAVVHLHTDYGISLSNQMEGLQPVAQSSIPSWMQVAYHDWEGFAVNDSERASLIKNLGSKNALILRNHGTLTCGKTIGEAFELMFFLEKACRIQVLSQSTGQALYKPAEHAIENAMRDLRVVAGKSGSDALVWPALIRKMDRLDPSFRN
jgi:ribulose-5-phosphate 4-epimerase/fuculose-1-phosphate aldolase